MRVDQALSRFELAPIHRITGFQRNRPEADFRRGEHFRVWLQSIRQQSGPPRCIQQSARACPSNVIRTRSTVNFTLLCFGIGVDLIPPIPPCLHAFRQKSFPFRCPAAKAGTDAIHQAKLRESENCLLTSRLRERVHPILVADRPIFIRIETTIDHLDEGAKQYSFGRCA